jgi:hypothetical protein
MERVPDHRSTVTEAPMTHALSRSLTDLQAEAREGRSQAVDEAVQAETVARSLGAPWRAAAAMYRAAEEAADVPTARRRLTRARLTHRALSPLPASRTVVFG